MDGPNEELDVWWQIGLATVGRGYRLMLHCRYSGLELIPAEGPALLAVNHVSVLDPIAVALGTASRGRALRFLALADVFAHPILGPGLRLVGQIPVRRGLRDLTALEELTDVLRDGGLAGIFPEGRVADAGGDGPSRPLRGRSGMVRVASSSGVPILPVGIWGTQDRWPRPGPRFSRPARTPVMVAFGAPIDVGRDATASQVAIRRTTAQVMRVIEGLVTRARAAQEMEIRRLLPPRRGPE